MNNFVTEYSNTVWKVHFTPEKNNKQSIFGVIFSYNTDKLIKFPEYFCVQQDLNAKKIVIEELKKQGVVRKAYDNDFLIYIFRNRLDNIYQINIIDIISNVLLMCLKRVV